MSEKHLRNIFLFGTLFFLLVLGAMTVDSLSQISTTRTAPVTDTVAEGKRTWQSKNCNDCHTILGIGGYYAPDLTNVVDRRGVAWLRDWLTNPQAVNANTTMPNQALSAIQVEQMTAFLEWVGTVDTNNWPPQPLANLGGSALSGALLFQQKGCTGCHRVNGQGATGPGPDLSQIGKKPWNDLPNTPEFLALWLDDPKAQKTDATMPRIPLTRAERDALVEYLVSLD